MTSLLRFTAMLSASLGLIIGISMAVGQLPDAIMVVGNQEIESQIYTVYVEDTLHQLRVSLEGTRCFEALPTWVYPEESAKPVSPPIPNASRFAAAYL